MKTIKNTTRDNLLGFIVIKQDCKIRYGNLIQGLENGYERGQVTSFPMSLELTYKMMVDYREYPYISNKVHPDIETGVGFSQGKYYNVNPKNVHLTCKIC